MKKIDGILLVNTLSLTFFGLFMIFDASSFIAFRDFADKYYYVKEQSTWIVIGILSMIFFTYFDYRKFYILALPILVSAIILLVLVFVPGLSIQALGAKRWINMGFFVLQPAEYVKLALAIYLSAWFSAKEKERFWAFLLLLGLVLTLVMLEPDMGTATIILSEAILLYFLSGGAILHFLMLIPAVAVAGLTLIFAAPYRAKRLMSFFDSQTFEQTSYHVKQILIALGAGGLTGLGLGNSLQKYAYLPENATDSIFAIIAEELGFIGATFLIVLFGILVWRGFVIAMKAKDSFGKLLASGIIGFLAIQAFINLAAQTVLIPLTGVPLPFISYGGSALVVDMTAVGILLNISKQTHG